MGVRSILSKPISFLIAKDQEKWSSAPVKCQRQILNELIKTGSNTLFGKDHSLSQVNNYDEYKSAIPVRDYEGLKPYVDKIIEGRSDVLWKGKPLYFAKTSGTTSGAKYIPITEDSVSNHITSARNAMLSYIHETGDGSFLDRKLIFLSGSPVLEQTGGVPTGRLSGIVNHHIPRYLRSKQMPSYETNCIDDWEDKVERIIDETLAEDMGLISGIPPWVQMYFDRINERTGKRIKDVFPGFSMFIYGGVNFEPYRQKLYESIGEEVASIETYPASEGFIAYQDTQSEEGLLLLVNSGIFFEFIPEDEFFDENPTRINLEEVKIGVNYAVILNSNAGLWGYNLGDTIRFVSTRPYRLVVTGRIEHFISAFGEHVIVEEVEKAMKRAMESFPETELVEFTVAPQVNPDSGLPHHEWFVEFRTLPKEMDAFGKKLNLQLQDLNSYYQDLIQGGILSELKISLLHRDAFRNYMKSLGKLGGQNKVPRLANDRQIADSLQDYRL